MNLIYFRIHWLQDCPFCVSAASGVKKKKNTPASYFLFHLQGERKEGFCARCAHWGKHLKRFIISYPFIRVQGEISTVLYKDQIKYLKSEGAWPKEFDESDTPLDKLNQLSVKVKYSNMVALRLAIRPIFGPNIRIRNPIR